MACSEASGYSLRAADPAPGRANLTTDYIMGFEHPKVHTAEVSSGPYYSVIHSLCTALSFMSLCLQAHPIAADFSKLQSVKHATSQLTH
jgi:hypothetical protein